jgi:hypothetical protein
MLFLNMVCLTVAFASGCNERPGLTEKRQKKDAKKTREMNATTKSREAEEGINGTKDFAGREQAWAAGAGMGRGVPRGVSKGVEDRRRPLALQVGHP